MFCRCDWIITKSFLLFFCSLAHDSDVALERDALHATLTVLRKSWLLRLARDNCDLIICCMQNKCVCRLATLHTRPSKRTKQYSTIVKDWKLCYERENKWLSDARRKNVFVRCYTHQEMSFLLKKHNNNNVFTFVILGVLWINQFWWLYNISTSFSLVDFQKDNRIKVSGLIFWRLIC